ncbi:hypothetical protein FIBSPDRAFT_928239 [Athelia psychrophila]|uniref:Uncharacterized protein n=1 Tax=Athelia psychrophila TaxID=1759441 RepID=A0A166QER2_9AGAM|nr:hypothetical protein FIBSPDRAFT_928239 [Fibularhizoctonia sp. CBS 109695]
MPASGATSGAFHDFTGGRDVRWISTQEDSGVWDVRARYLCELCNSPRIRKQAGDANGGIEDYPRTAGPRVCPASPSSVGGSAGGRERWQILGTSTISGWRMIQGVADVWGMPSETGGNGHAYVVEQKGARKPNTYGHQLQMQRDQSITERKAADAPGFCYGARCCMDMGMATPHSARHALRATEGPHLGMRRRRRHALFRRAAGIAISEAAEYQVPGGAPGGFIEAGSQEYRTGLIIVQMKDEFALRMAMGPRL